MPQQHICMNLHCGYLTPFTLLALASLLLFPSDVAGEPQTESRTLEAQAQYRGRLSSKILAERLREPLLDPEIPQAEFDVPQLIALVAPRPVAIQDPEPKVRDQLRGLKSWYATLGTDFDPLP